MPTDPTFPCKPVANGCMVLWVKNADEKKRCPRKVLLPRTPNTERTQILDNQRAVTNLQVGFSLKDWLIH